MHQVFVWLLVLVLVSFGHMQKISNLGGLTGSDIISGRGGEMGSEVGGSPISLQVTPSHPGLEVVGIQ